MILKFSLIKSGDFLIYHLIDYNKRVFELRGYSNRITISDGRVATFTIGGYPEIIFDHNGAVSHIYIGCEVAKGSSDSLSYKCVGKGKIDKAYNDVLIVLKQFCSENSHKI